MATDGPVGRRDRRGQLILVGAFALAVTFIALALVLNAAIYTENLATQSESTGTTEAQAYEQAAKQTTVDAIQYTNEFNDSDDYDAIEANVTAAVAAASAFSTRERVFSGHVANYSVASTTEGTRIRDDGHFRSEADVQNWTVVQDTRAREFRVYVDSFNVSHDGDLEIVANRTDRRWTLNLSAGRVGVNDSGDYDYCSAPASDYWVNITAGTVDDEPCGALNFTESVSGDYDLKIVNGSRVTGRYSLIAATDVAGRYAGTPITADRVLYATTLDLTYRTPELRYRTEIRIAPGENRE